MGRRKPPEPPVDLDAACAERGCKRPHSHGEARTAKTHGCRCQPCGTARWRRDQRRQHARHRGLAVPQYGPADDVRAHIAKLTETGATLGAIAAAAQVHRDTVTRLLRDPGRMVQAEPRRRILSVRPSDVDGLGTSIGAHRRLQALAALGWSSARIAADAGMCPRVVLGYTTGDRDIRTPARRLIVATYRRLSNQRPPADTAGQKASITYALNNAARRGWVTPAAWDDIDHDEAPSIPALERRPGCVGIDPDDIRLILSTCRTSYEAADRLKVTRPYLIAQAKRYGVALPLHIIAGDRDRRQMQIEGKLVA